MDGKCSGLRGCLLMVRASWVSGMNATTTQVSGDRREPRATRGEDCHSPITSVDAPRKSHERDRRPGDWFAISELHEDFWRRVRPIVTEMERLRREYGAEGACKGRMTPACPPHVETSLRNWEQSIAHIHRAIFGTARRNEREAGRVYQFPEPHPLSCEIHHQRKAA